MVGYKLTRESGGGNWMHAGFTPAEVAEAVKNEIDAHGGLSAEEIDTITIEPYETTREAAAALPEFEGW